MTRCRLVVPTIVAALVGVDPVPDPVAATPVRLVSRRIETSSMQTDVAAELTRAASVAGGRHLLVQLSGAPDATTRAALASRGVDLLRYVPDDAWITRVSFGADVDDVVLREIGWAGELLPLDKIAASLRGGSLPPWALRPDGRIEVRVRLHDDVASSSVTAALEALGAEPLRELAMFPGYVVAVRPEALVEIARHDAVLWVEERVPDAVSDNDGIRARIGADALHVSEDLEGAGFGVGMWDIGIVDPGHADFAGRLVVGDAGTVSAHATHVAGTLLGSGALSGALGGDPLQWRGVAPLAELYTYDTSGVIISEILGAVQAQGFRIEHNSWGFPVSAVNCADYGDYRLLAPEFDALVRGEYGTPVTVVFSAGNERNDGDCPLVGGGYACIPPPKTAKNPIVVGATNSNDDTMTLFSSWGPVDDGRLKPDLTAPGCESGTQPYVQSTLPGNVYGGPTWCGTSMAAPAVTGTIVLMHERYGALTAGDVLPPALTKAVLVTTAEDLGNPGPDYAFGHGRIDAGRAIDELTDSSQYVFQLAHGQSGEQAFEVPPGLSSLRVALVWDDPDATPLASPALVNNLDLRLRDPLGGIHYPWVLNPQSPASNAVRVIDTINNVEHLTVDAPMSGTWQLVISATNVPEGSQRVYVAGLDGKPPGAPLSPVVDGNTDTSIDLTWTNPPASDFEGTLVVRSLDPRAWSGPTTGEVYDVDDVVAPDAVVLLADASDYSHAPFTDDGLVQGETYYYDFYAYDEMRNYSPVATTVGVAGGAVSVDVVGAAAALHLDAPRPNPTRRGSTVRFSLPEPGLATLRVYDAGGRHVATLMRGPLDAASYEVRWDGRDAAGRTVGPGVYFFALESPSGRLTRRVTRID